VAHQALQENLEPLDRQELLAPPERVAYLALMDPQGPLVLLEHPDHREHPDLQVLLVRQEPLDLQVLLVLVELRVQEY
jgi:hypothetical protein